MDMKASDQSGRPESHAQVGPGRLAVYFGFAWAVSVVCGMSATLTAVSFFDLQSDAGFSLKLSLIGLALAFLTYGSGAFVLGSIARGAIKEYVAIAIYVMPFFLFRGTLFAGSFWVDAVRDEMLSNPVPMVVMPILYLVCAPFVSLWFFRIGAGAGENFAEPNSAFGIAWFHWCWMVPFALFQVIGVPTYLVMLLWYIDLHSPLYASVLDLPAFLPRIIIFLILAGCVMLIVMAYDALSHRSGSVVLRTLKVAGAWLGLTVIQLLIIVVAIGRHLD